MTSLASFTRTSTVPAWSSATEDSIRRVRVLFHRQEYRECVAYCVDAFHNNGDNQVHTYIHRRATNVTCQHDTKGLIRTGRLIYIESHGVFRLLCDICSQLHDIHKAFYSYYAAHAYEEMASQANATSSNKIGLLRLARENFSACKMALEQGAGTVELIAKKGEIEIAHPPYARGHEREGKECTISKEWPGAAKESGAAALGPKHETKNMDRVGSKTDCSHGGQDTPGLGPATQPVRPGFQVNPQMAQPNLRLTVLEPSVSLGSTSPGTTTGRPHLPNVPDKNPKRYRLSRSGPLFGVPLTLPIHDSPPSRNTGGGLRLAPSPLRVRKMGQRKVSGQWSIYEDAETGVEADAGGHADGDLSNPVRNSDSRLENRRLTHSLVTTMIPNQGKRRTGFSKTAHHQRKNCLTH